MAVEGLIIPRSYNDYFSRSDPAAIRELVDVYTDDALSSASENPVQNKVVKAALDDIEALIPTQAAADNQLADKNFVNSSISTNTANYISDNGQPFASVAALEAYTGTVTNNDYAFVTGTDSEGNTYYDRYKATVSGSSITWALEYRLNNSSFTAAQWAALNSGITAAKVAQYDAAIGVTFDDYPSSASTNPVKASGIFAASQTITANSTTITGAPIEAGSNIKLMFTAAITGSDTTTGLSLTYNGTSYAVKVGKQGALADLLAHEVTSGVYTYMQAYTTIELIFNGSVFVVLGNPVVLSSANYTIYADGYYKYTNIVANKPRWTGEFWSDGKPIMVIYEPLNGYVGSDNYRNVGAYAPDDLETIISRSNFLSGGSTFNDTLYYNSSWNVASRIAGTLTNALLVLTYTRSTDTAYTIPPINV